MPVEKLKYNTCLANYFLAQPLFFDGDLQKKPHVRKCMELPYQQTKAELWDEVTETLCNLDFIQAKAVAKMTYDLVKDFNDVLEVIPDNAENIRQEKTRQARMEKYTRDLIACAKGEISLDDLEIPESITPWSQEKIDAEIERIKINPTRADKLKDFKIFLEHEADNLQTHASGFSYFSLQRAWNWTDDGPVGIAANNKSNAVSRLLFMKLNNCRPSWKPLPLAEKMISYQENYLRKCNITPDGKNAVARDDNNFVTIDLISREIKNIITTNLKSDVTLSACISLDCKYAVIGYNDEMIYWSLQDNKELKRILLPDDYKAVLNRNDSKKSEKKNITQRFTNSLDISADCRILVSGHEDNSVRIWDIDTGEQIRILSNSLENTIVKVTPDGKYAISSSNNFADYKINIWNLLDGKMIVSLKCYQSISSFSITPDLKYVIYGTYNGLLYYYESVSKTVKKIIISENHISIIRPLDITADGRFAIFSIDYSKNLYIYDLLNGIQIKIIRSGTGITDIKITPDGRTVILLDGENNILVWDIEKGCQTDNKKLTHSGSIEKVYIGSNGDYAYSSSSDETLMIWDFKTGEVLRKLGSHTATINSFDISDDDLKIVTSGSWDQSIIIQNLNNLSNIKICDAHNHIINIVKITPDNNRIISCSDDQTVAIWDIESGQLINRFEDHKSWVRKLELTPCGKYAVTAGDKIIVYNLELGNIVSTYNYEDEHLHGFKILPDGKSALIIHSNGKVVIWLLLTGKAITCYNIPYEWRFPISIDWSGKSTLLSFLDNSIRRMNIKSGKFDQVFVGHYKSIVEIQTFSNDKYFVSCSLDKNLILWDIENGIKKAVYPNSSNYKSLNINTKGIIAGDRAGGVLIFDLRNKLGFFNQGIVTLRSIWNFRKRKYLTISSVCPFCGHHFLPEKNIIDTINGIIQDSKICPQDSPCLKLPDEAWEDPGLLGNCPKCGAELKFNPFIAGGEF